MNPSMKQVSKSILSFFFVTLVFFNVSGLGVLLMHSEHKSFVEEVSHQNHSVKVLKMGFGEQKCQCACHFNLNHFDEPDFLSFSTDYPEIYFRELPPEILLKDGRTILLFKNGRAPPFIA